MIEILAALSASAAAGIRVALPLLVIGLLQGDNLWSFVPILSRIPSPLMLGVLTTWSLIELFASKKLLGQRLLQVVQLVFSPIVGAIVAIAVSQVREAPTWLIGLIGALFAFVLQLVQAGWFYRWRGLPLWVVFIQDALCVSLVFFAFKAPQLGGLIALILLWVAVRSSRDLYRWYKEGQGIKGKGQSEEDPL
jgi:hypothetical protein